MQIIPGHRHTNVTHFRCRFFPEKYWPQPNPINTFELTHIHTLNPHFAFHFQANPRLLCRNSKPCSKLLRSAFLFIFLSSRVITVMNICIPLCFQCFTFVPAHTFQYNLCLTGTLVVHTSQKHLSNIFNCYFLTFSGPIDFLAFLVGFALGNFAPVEWRKLANKNEIAIEKFKLTANFARDFSSNSRKFRHTSSRLAQFHCFQPEADTTHHGQT